MPLGDRVGHEARPLDAARARLDRRAVEPGALALVLRGGRRRALPDHQLLAAAPRSAAASSAATRSTRSSRARSPARSPAWPPTWSTTQGNPVRGAVGELVDPPALARDDARLLARPGALPRDLLVAHSRTSGSTATGRTIDDDGFWYIQGRSDDTIKVAGKRVGPAEVESAAVGHPAVQRRPRSACRTRSRARAWSCSWSCSPSEEPADALRDGIKDAVAAELGRPLRPEEVRFVQRPAEDAQRQDHAPGDPREAPRRTDLGDLSGWRTRPRSRRSPGALTRRFEVRLRRYCTLSQHRLDHRLPLIRQPPGRRQRRPLLLRPSRFAPPNLEAPRTPRRTEIISKRSASYDDGRDTQCDPFGIPSTSHWTGAAIIGQGRRTKSCIVTGPRASRRPMPCSLAG